MPENSPGVASSLLANGTVTSHTSLSGGEGPELHPLVRDFLATLPPSRREPFVGLCAESLLVSDRLWQFESEQGGGATVTFEAVKPLFAGSAIISRLVRDPGDPDHGRSVPPCRSCAALAERLGIRVVVP
ncbi:YwqJ-related putative deaminase [Kitasatospora sp. NPDC088134]|uniref:YwqJ-related putative deaminase n=1 Tax=Kitasatospora sp. NPDC088134 TaxID=3364071 RepID=UPI0037FF4CCA